nr:hypothetical protein [Angustibacter aerolatus]
MKIVVCVKYVPDAQADRRFRDADATTDREGVDGRLSEPGRVRPRGRPHARRGGRGRGGRADHGSGRGRRRREEVAADGCPLGRARARRRHRRVGLRRHLAGAGQGGREGRRRRPGADRHGLDRRLDERRAGHARRAPRAAAGHVRQRA